MTKQQIHRSTDNRDHGGRVAFQQKDNEGHSEQQKCDDPLMLGKQFDHGPAPQRKKACQAITAGKRELWKINIPLFRWASPRILSGVAPEL